MVPLTNSTDLIILLTLAALLAPLGIGLLVVARRRRVGARPYCGKCDYALVGLPDETTRCPECGASLTAVGAVATGRPQPDRALTVAGVALLLPALVIGGLFTTRKLTSPPAVTTRVLMATRSPLIFTPGFKVRPLPAPATDAYPNLSNDALADAILAVPPRADEAQLLITARPRRRHQRRARTLATRGSPAWSPPAWRATPTRRNRGRRSGPASSSPCATPADRPAVHRNYPNFYRTTGTAPSYVLTGAFRFRKEVPRGHDDRGTECDRM
jgi:hypothetical protein